MAYCGGKGPAVLGRTSCSGVIAWSAAKFNLAKGGESRNVEGLYVNGEFFQHLGVTPLLGRVFSSTDDAETCTGAGAVVSEGFWRRELGGDPDLAGRKVSLDGHSFPDSRRQSDARGVAEVVQ